jgi:hypothetical protein
MDLSFLPDSTKPNPNESISVLSWGIVPQKTFARSTLTSEERKNQTITSTVSPSPNSITNSPNFTSSSTAFGDPDKIQDCLKAPLPMSQVLNIEKNSEMNSGDYFIHLMHRRLNALVHLQNKWLKRQCNKHHIKHIQVQQKMILFLQQCIEDLEHQYPQSKSDILNSKIKSRTKMKLQHKF